MRDRTAVLAAAVAAIACAARPPPPRAAPAPPANLAGPPLGADEAPPALQLPDDVRPLRYTIALDVDPARDGFSGTAEIQIALARPRSVLWMHARGLRVTSASVAPEGGAEVPARLRQVNDDGLARLEPATPVGPGRAVLRFAWNGAWGDGSGLFRARFAGDAYAVTQLEAHHARRVFPAFDEPGFKTPFDVTLTVPAGAVAVSNGRELDGAPADGGRRRLRFATTRPLPTYLVFVGVGPFDVVDAPAIPASPVRATPIPLRGLAPRGRGAELAAGLRAAAESLAWEERWFGIPYPYEKLDQIVVPGFGSAGMENAGAIAYADRALLIAPGASPQQLQDATWVVAHEVAHQWFGDLVTLPWWTDVWLNESFATWMASRALEALHPEWRPRVGEVRGGFPGGEPSVNRAAVGGVEWTKAGDALPTARAIRKPLARMSEVNAQFDASSYTKGAAVLGMFERWAGADAFRDGVRAFVAAHADGTGTTADLLARLSRAAGRDLATPLATFLDRPGVPTVTAETRCEAGAAEVRLSQVPTTVPGVEAAPPGSSWQLPVCVRYGAAGASHERCVLLDGAAGALPIPEGCPAWIFPDAGGNGYYRVALAAPDLERLRRAGLPHLDAREKLALAGSARASARSGRIPYAQAMDLLALLARDADRAVAVAPAPALAHARRDLLPATARADVEAWTRAAYGPALVRLGWTPRPGEDAEARRYRAELVRLLVRTARDPTATREAARRGRAFLGIGGTALSPAAVDPDLAEDAVVAAVAAGGAAALDVAVERALTTTDGAARERILHGIGAARRPELVSRAFALAGEARLAPVERLWAIEGAFKDPATRGAALDALERDADALVAAVPPGPRRFLLTSAAWLCDARDADRLQAALAPRLGAAPDLRPALADAVTRIRACAAERDAQALDAARWFRTAPRRAAAR